MRRLLLATLVASPAAYADNLGQSTTALLYWQMSLGALDKRGAASVFGFRLDQAKDKQNVVLNKPIMDVRFNDRGFHSLALRGTVLHQNQPASGGPAPEINWWIVGAVLGGAALFIANEERKSKQQQSNSPSCQRRHGRFPSGPRTCLFFRARSRLPTVEQTSGQALAT